MVIPHTVVDFNHKKVVTVEELLEHYFPEGVPLSSEDFAEVERTAYLLYQYRREMRCSDYQEPELNWKRAERIVAIRKYLKERRKRNERMVL